MARWGSAVAIIGSLALATYFGVSSGTGDPDRTVPTSLRTPTSSRTPTSATGRMLTDSFDRPDGSLGRFPDGPMWSTTGASPPVIAQGRLRVPSEPGGYAYADFNSVPVAFGASVIWQPAGTTGVLALLSQRSDKPYLSDVVHVIVAGSGWAVQIIDGPLNVAGVETIRGGGFPAVKADGVTAYHVSVEVAGETVTVTDPHGSQHSITDPRLGRFWGPRLTWEMASQDGAVAPMVDSAWVTLPPM